MSFLADADKNRHNNNNANTREKTVLTSVPVVTSEKEPAQQPIKDKKTGQPAARQRKKEIKRDDKNKQKKEDAQKTKKTHP